MGRIVPLITLPHTGTRFLRHFLEGLPGIDHTVEVGRVFAHGGPAIPEGVTLVWGHYDPEQWRMLAPICRLVNPIVPMRDPLAVAISHEVRGSKMEWGWWEHAVDALDSHRAHYVALDRTRTNDGRLLDLMLIAATAGIGHFADTHCREWAGHWAAGRHRHEKSEDHALKAMYRARDLPGLQAAIPDVFERLAGLERVLRPWLLRMGYRDLMWWPAEHATPAHWPDPGSLIGWEMAHEALSAEA